MSVLAQWAQRETIAAPVALVVAHPDDETLALGGSLHLFKRLVLVHVTDGAPRRLADAARSGFATPADYAAARAAELERALALSGCAPVRHQLGIADQDAVDAIGTIAQRVRALADHHGLVAAITHAYEGGHPDHDAVAAAVHAAGVPVLEFPLYRAGAGDALDVQRFLPGDGAQSVTLSAEDAARKRAMLACFATQSAFLQRFDPATERLRPAPSYCFEQPPHAGAPLYERWGWLRFVDWSGRARCAA